MLSKRRKNCDQTVWMNRLVEIRDSREKHVSCTRSCVVCGSISPVGGDEESITKFMAIEPAKDQAEAEDNLSKGYMAIIGSLLYML